jgi:hypothetical protein
VLYFSTPILSSLPIQEYYQLAEERSMLLPPSFPCLCSFSLNSIISLLYPPVTSSSSSLYPPHTLSRLHAGMSWNLLWTWSKPHLNSVSTCPLHRITRYKFVYLPAFLVFRWLQYSMCVLILMRCIFNAVFVRFVNYTECPSDTVNCCCSTI